MGRKSNEQKAAEEAAKVMQEESSEANQDMAVSEVEQAAETVAEVVEEVEEKMEQIEEVEVVQTVRMVRHADYDGDGAMTADVHPLEVDNYRIGGWIVEE